MYRVIRFLDDLLDKLLALVLVLVLLIGVYFMYDTAYVFYHASAGRVTVHRPGSGDASVGEKPLTDDYAAWITLEDTGVDYPVMQADNNDKYLTTDPYGDYSLAGSIFLDYRNSSDFSDSYSLIYGHHMANNLMFGALDKYYDETYFEKHRAGTLTVGEKDIPLEVFAVMQTDALVVDIFNPAGSRPVLKLAKETAVLYREPASTHLVALSTCVDGGSTTRTVVLCALLDET